MAEWQPIETAPKDGTKIDVCNRYGERTTDVYWALSAWRHWAPTLLGSMGPVKVEPAPAYWMPLPAPPAAE